jgi:ABC-type branched-subunit amino acid transport system permease subunit
VSTLLSYLVDTLIFINIFAILALSLNLEVGVTRLMNFGKVAFFAIGAYSSALVTLAGYPFWLGLLCGIVIAGITGFLVSIPALRLREDYLAIATIAFGEIIRLFLLNERWLTRGPIGLRGIPRPLKDVPMDYQTFYLLFSFAFLVVVFLFLHRVISSPFGRVLKAIREDELVAQSLGKNTFRFKAQAFVLGSSIASIAGSLFAHYLTFISPDMFMPTVTFAVWTMVVVGGRGNALGVVAGAALIQFMERTTRIMKDIADIGVEPVNLRMVLLGLLLILFIMYRPQGIFMEKKYEV